MGGRWPGWYVVGFLFALAGLAVPPAIRWAQRHQPTGRPDSAAEALATA
jgi:hypothetical protein